VALLLALAGCGIPTDGTPRPLADESSTTAPPASEPVDSADSVTLYLAETNDRLVTTRRGLDGEPSPQRVLDALLAGPLDEEKTDQGYITLIPVGTEAEVTVDGDLLVIRMSSEWESLTNGATVAYAQVVLTVTRNLPDIRRVSFRVGENVVPAPTPDSGTPDVVTRQDYAAFEPAGDG